MRLFSPAKINLHLRILGRRADGYHDLYMLMEKLDLCDAIELEITKGSLEIATPIEGVSQEENLIYRAALLLQKESGVSCGVRISQIKQIPMGGGLGGGSSNAATVLKGLNELWGLDWPVARLAEIGVQIGADVPFFLYDGPAIVEGIGDLVTPIAPLPKLPLILLNPGVHVATPLAYRLWDDAQLSSAETTTLLHNDFEKVILDKHPEIATAKKTLLATSPVGALMSGSGSTLFAIYDSVSARDTAFTQLQKKAQPEWKLFKASN